MSDRFFLGGPQSVRGYKLKGLGPRSKGDSFAWNRISGALTIVIDDYLGGDAYLSGSLAVSLPIPHKSVIDKPLRVHLFMNAGSLIMIDHGLVLSLRTFGF